MSHYLLQRLFISPRKISVVITNEDYSMAHKRKSNTSLETIVSSQHTAQTASHPTTQEPKKNYNQVMREFYSKDSVEGSVKRLGEILAGDAYDAQTNKRIWTWVDRQKAFNEEIAKAPEAEKYSTEIIGIIKKNSYFRRKRKEIYKDIRTKLETLDTYLTPNDANQERQTTTTTKAHESSAPDAEVKKEQEQLQETTLAAKTEQTLEHKVSLPTGGSVVQLPDHGKLLVVPYLDGEIRTLLEFERKYKEYIESDPNVNMLIFGISDKEIKYSCGNEDYIQLLIELKSRYGQKLYILGNTTSMISTSAWSPEVREFISSLPQIAISSDKCVFTFKIPGLEESLQEIVSTSPFNEVNIKDKFSESRIEKEINKKGFSFSITGSSPHSRYFEGSIDSYRSMIQPSEHSLILCKSHQFCSSEDYFGLVRPYLVLDLSQLVNIEAIKLGSHTFRYRGKDQFPDLYEDIKAFKV